MAMTNAERQARWRQRHRAEILARRDADRARTAARMELLNPWTASLPSLESLAATLPGIEALIDGLPSVAMCDRSDVPGAGG